MDRKSINKAYGDDNPSGYKTSDKQCAMYVMPYRNVDWVHSLLWRKKPFEYKNEAQKISKLMLQSTLRPQAVRDTVKDYVNKIFNDQPYVSMHWRYNLEDFGKHCSREGEPEANFGNRESICAALLGGHIDADIIAQRLANWIQGLEVSGSPPIKHVYIAAPLTEKSFITKIQKHFQKKDIGQVFFQDSLKTFLDKKFSSCDSKTYNNQINDFMSQVEQEICLRSKVFIQSEGSSWTLGLMHERYVRGVDEDDFSNTHLITD